MRLVVGDAADRQKLGIAGCPFANRRSSRVSSLSELAVRGDVESSRVKSSGVRGCLSPVDVAREQSTAVGRRVALWREQLRAQPRPQWAGGRERAAWTGAETRITTGVDMAPNHTRDSAVCWLQLKKKSKNTRKERFARSLLQGRENAESCMTINQRFSASY